jgi:hypothetical protein
MQTAGPEAGRTLEARRTAVEAAWPLRSQTVGPVRRGWIFVYPGSLRNSVSAW